MIWGEKGGSEFLDGLNLCEKRMKISSKSFPYFPWLENVWETEFRGPNTKILKCFIFREVEEIIHSWGIVLKWRHGINFISILRAPFLYKGAFWSFSLITVWLCNFFGVSILAQKLLVKCWWNGLMVIWTRNQFHQHFTLAFLRQYFCAKKLHNQNVTREKLRKALLYKKFSSKMLMKLTQGIKDFVTHYCI